MNRSALLVVDVQNDFCPGGALAVTDGDKVIQPLNRMVELFGEKKERRFFSRDWHIRGAKHFETWPVHCIAGTPGAEFHPDLLVPKDAYIISKGYGNNDGYSPFEGLWLRENDWPTLFQNLLPRVTDLYIGGLATDYCVKAACLDARKLGYTVYLLTDACRVVNLKPTDEADAIEEMRLAGVIFTTTDEVIAQSR